MGTGCSAAGRSAQCAGSVGFSGWQEHARCAGSAECWSCGCGVRESEKAHLLDARMAFVPAPAGLNRMFLK